MLTRRAFFFLTVVGSGWSALAATAPIASEPATRPSMSTDSLQSCVPEGRLAKAAIGARNGGKTKEFMASPLPPRETTTDPKGLLMYRILDEVYGSPEIEEFSYFVYRYNMCLRRFDGMPTPPPEVEMMPAILACQTQFRSAKGNALTDCIEVAIESAAKPKQPNQPLEPTR